MFSFQIRQLGLRLASLLLVYSLIRFAFLVLHWQALGQESAFALIRSFYLGLRFDLSAIAFLNAPFIILALLPLAILLNPVLQELNRFCFWALNFFFIGANVTDLELVRFTGKRVNWDIFSIREDIQQHSWSVLSTYWPHSLFLIFLGVLLYFFDRNTAPKDLNRLSPSRSVIFALIILAGSVLAMRGGLQLKPIKPINAFQYGSQELGLLTLNSTFTLLTSKKGPRLQPVKEYSSAEELLEVLKFEDQFVSHWHGRFKGYNLVIILLESFGSEYVGHFNSGKGYTPFLDSLIKESLVFENHFSNGRRSIEAIPAVLSGIPSLMEEPFLTSNFQSNRIQGLAEIFKKQDYSTSFFHGAQNGSMFFDSFAARTGFESYFGLSEFPDPSQSDGQWGIYDEAFFQFFSEQLGETRQPFFGFIFTLSSHHPYKIPEQYKGKFPLGELEIHPSIGYTDFALARFFESAKKQDWFKKTLFVITSDHTQLSNTPKYQTQSGVYRVPLLFYSEGMDWTGVSGSRVSQHVDLVPTLLDLFGVQGEPLNYFGQSLFNSGQHARVVNSSPRGIWLMDRNNFVELNTLSRQVSCHSLDGSWPGETSGPSFSFEESLAGKSSCAQSGALALAYFQYFVNALLNNSLFP